MSVKKIKKVKPPYPFESYTHVVSPLSAEDGGGFLITFPDLPGCISDGETMEEAIENGRDAFVSWVSARVDMKKTIPKPVTRQADADNFSGRFVQRVPKISACTACHAGKKRGCKSQYFYLEYYFRRAGPQGLNRHR